MKKFTLATLFSVLAVFAGSSFAAYNGPQQAGMPSGPLNTVKAVQDLNMMHDDMQVTLTGKITQSLGGEHYVFTDKTGSINVEIDHEDWRGVNVNANTTVTIYGELDQDFGGKKIDVDFIRVG